MTQGHFTLIDWVILVVYFFAMAMIGPIVSRKGRTTEGYFVGNRAYPGWLIGITMFATSISSITFMAYPADAYKTAYLRYMICLMLPVAVYIASYVFLPFYRRGRITSAFEYLEGRFGPGVRAYAASAFIVGQLLRLSMILYLVSLLVHEMTDMSAFKCILIGGVVTSFYTIMGGIEAVVWTDFIQSFLLWGAGLVCVLTIIFKVDGGLARIITEAAADGKFMIGDLNPATNELEPAKWGFSLNEKTLLMMFLIGMNNWLTEYSSNQNVIQKFCATKSAKEARKAIWVCVLCSVPTWGFFMFLGTCLYVYYKLNPDPQAEAMLTGAMKADQILPHFVVQVLPAGFSGLVIAGVLAAAMSSLSSSINAVSAVSIVDIYKRHVMKNRSDRHYVIVAKTIAFFSAVIMIVGASILMAADSKTLNDTSTKLAALAAGGLLGLYALGFLTKRGDGRAVATGIVCMLAFSAWMSAIELKWITADGLYQTLGLSPGAAAWFARPMDTYYAGLVGIVFMFVIAYMLSIWFTKERDLRNLTVWTQDGTPLD